jgi:translation initiation factor IF-1
VQNNKESKEITTQEGVVIESLPGATFKVKLDDGREILAHLSGRMRLNFIRVLIGDRVKLEMSPYDQTKGRIVYRNK